MRRTSLALVAATVVASGACDQPRRAIMGPQEPHSIRLPVPDAEFHLSASERARVRQGFDPDALERLLANVEPVVRPMILQSFQQPKPGEPADNVVRMGDPSLQPLLDEVWAPMWDLFSSDAIEKETKDFPGREIARQRRAARGAPHTE
jgi:hypothetical protein